MKTEIEKLDLKTIIDMAGEDHGEYVGEELFVSMSSQQFGMKFLQIGHPYRVPEGRVMRVVSGEATCLINLRPYTLLPQTLLIIPSDSIFEIESYDEDFDIQAFSLINLPQNVDFKTCTELRLTDDDWQLTGEYFDLLWHEVNCRHLSLIVVSHLQTTLLTRLHVIHEKVDNTGKQHSLSRQEFIFHRFLTLLNEHGMRERSISFYAEHLCVTPNHLGFVIRQISGLTVMQWVNRYIIQQAKVQLKYSDLPVWEIAENLNFSNPSFFSKFFKKETGVSPVEYRNK